MKTTMMLIIMLNAAAGLAATVPNPTIWFKARDTDHNGRISQEEFIRYQRKEAAKKDKNWPIETIKRRFSQYDRNCDGVIELTELMAPTVSAVPKRQSRGSFNPKAYRDLVFRDGRTFRGKVLAYDRHSRQVSVQNDKGVCCKVDIDLFSAADQGYILDWKLHSGFTSDSRFKVSAKRKTFDEDKKRHIHEYYGVENAKTTIEFVGYEITIENRLAAELRNVSVEYCIYYEQERAERDKQVTDEGVKRGTLHISKLNSKTTTTLKTESVILREHELSADWFYYDGRENKQRGKVVGIWVKVHVPLSGGQQLTRQYALPDCIIDKKPWSDYGKPVGMNKR